MSAVEVRAQMAKETRNLDLKCVPLPLFSEFSAVNSHHARLFYKLNILRNFVHCFGVKLIDFVAVSVAVGCAFS